MLPIVIALWKIHSFMKGLRLKLSHCCKKVSFKYYILGL